MRQQRKEPIRFADRSAFGFTLIEVLVVISIVSLLIAILLPALASSRSRAVQIACASQQRQLYLQFVTYSVDHKGNFPLVDWGNAQTLFWLDTAGPVWRAYNGYQAGYFPNREILYCPADDPTLRETPTYWGYQSQYNTWHGSYRMLAGWGTQGPSVTSFKGWQMYHAVTSANGKGIGIPNSDWAGRTISGYGSTSDWYGAVDLPQPVDQPVLLDMHNPVQNGVVYYGLTSTRKENNHADLDGENVVFLDGHGRWLDKDAVEPQRFKLFYDWVAW